MESSRWQRIEALFRGAREHPEAEREAYLRRECDDDDLRREVSRLLSQPCDDFLEHPAHLGSATTQERVPSPNGDSPGDGIEGTRLGPYEITRRIGEGGMGRVYLAEQREPVRRRVAVKVLRPGLDTDEVMARFELERHALALMNHPGIAAVFDAGRTPDGQPYFVLEHVAGEALDRYCDERRLDVVGRLDLFLRVCAAVQHAHQKGIVHRDLKPSNILVTERDGSPVPKIIDFGVAKAAHLRLTERTIFTEQGRLIGTPEYMSPEQAGMTGLDIDTRSDVYALGVLLYELLTGVLPFDREELCRDGFVGLQRIICDRDPAKPSTRLTMLGGGAGEIARRRRTEIGGLVRDIRGDLDWIIMKALEKDRSRRYASAAQLADDLRRHRSHEPVEAGPPGRWYRLHKFARKNRVEVAAVLAVGLVLLAGTVVSWILYRQAAAARGESDARYLEIVRLADLKRVQEFRRDADALWPPYPEIIPALETWLEEKAGPLGERLPAHEKSLEELQAGALPYDAAQRWRDRATHPRVGELGEAREALLDLGRRRGTSEVADPALEPAVRALRARIEMLEREIEARRTWRFPEAEIQWAHDTRLELVEHLRRFVDPDPGIGTRASVEMRLAFARTIEDRSRTGDEARRRWDEVRRDIARLDAYRGLELLPQRGLLPLRRDPHSGLWEFWHLQSGEEPRVGADGAWEMRGDTGVVLVLLPPGRFTMGASPETPVHRDPSAKLDEGPPGEVQLEPFFISRYELTIGQWLRVAGSPDPAVTSRSLPVAQVSWDESVEVLARLDLELPTEAQWEYAARAGTRTVYWTGADAGSLQGAANLADRSWERSAAHAVRDHEPEIDDGYLDVAPVGRFRPNPFGLHDVHGNLWEWCRDGYGPYQVPPRAGDALRESTESGYRVYRGGGYSNRAVRARSANRSCRPPQIRRQDLGVRPVRRLDR